RQGSRRSCGARGAQEGHREGRAARGGTLSPPCEPRLLKSERARKPCDARGFGLSTFGEPSVRFAVVRWTRATPVSHGDPSSRGSRIPDETRSRLPEDDLARLSGRPPAGLFPPGLLQRPSVRLPRFSPLLLPALQARPA